MIEIQNLSKSTEIFPLVSWKALNEALTKQVWGLILGSVSCAISPCFSGRHRRREVKPSVAGGIEIKDFTQLGEQQGFPVLSSTSLGLMGNYHLPLMLFLLVSDWVTETS